MERTNIEKKLINAISVYARLGDVENLKRCLEEDRDCGYGLVNEIYCGWTPLHTAAHLGHYECVKCLVEHGAGVDIKSVEDETCALILVVGLINDRTEEREKIIRYLIQNGADVNAQNKYLVTPAIQLLRAGGEGNLALRILLENGAVLSIRDQSNATAMDTAIQKVNEEAVMMMKAFSEQAKLLGNVHKDSWTPEIIAF